MTKATHSNDKNKTIKENYEYFKSQLPDLLERDAGKYALLRDKKIIGIYDTVRDAQMTGEKFYDDNLFSVQKIDNKPIELGFFSHAVSLG